MVHRIYTFIDTNDCFSLSLLFSLSVLNEKPIICKVSEKSLRHFWFLVFRRFPKSIFRFKKLISIALELLYTSIFPAVILSEWFSRDSQITFSPAEKSLRQILLPDRNHCLFLKNSHKMASFGF